MKYGPIFKRVDDFFGNSAFGHFVLFNALNLLLPRSWHLKRELLIWKEKHPNHQCVLDTGSGLGQYSYMLSNINKKWSVKGLDISDSLIAHSNYVFRKLKKENVIFKTADLTNFIANEAYDLALGMDIAEYVQDDKKNV